MTTTDDKAGPDAPAPATSRRGRPGGRTLAVIAAGLACLTCLLPVVVTGGIAAGIGALLAGVNLLTVVLAVAGVTATGAWLSRRRTSRHAGCACSAGPACGCVGTAGTPHPGRGRW